MKFIKFLMLVCLLISCVACSEKEVVEEMTEEVIEEVETEVELPKIVYDVKVRKGVDNIVYSDIMFPVELGEPEYLDQELDYFKDKNIYELYMQIHTYTDAIRMARVLGYNKLPDASLDAIAYFVAGDYEEIGKVKCVYSDNWYNFLYIKNNGRYIVCDPAADIRTGLWLESCDDNQFVFDSTDEMVEMMLTYQNMANMYYDVTVKSINIEPIELNLGKYEYLNAPNGEVLIAYEQNGIDMFDYCGIQFPKGLGLPELSRVKIDELIKEADYEKIAEMVNTVPDAVCYIISSYMTVDPIGSAKYNDLNVVNIGNIFYQGDGYTTYTATGPDIMKANCFQCTAGATLFNYLLYDNYPEFGYIKLSFSNNDGHAMIYIKAKDGKYYLLNPASYAYSPVDGVIYPDMLSNKWLEFYDKEKGYADSLEELIAEIYNSKNPGVPDAEASILITFSYDGVFAQGFSGNGFNSKDSVLYFPKGSNPICHYGDVEIHEKEFSHGVSQQDSTGVYNLYDNHYEVHKVKTGDVLIGEH